MKDKIIRGQCQELYVDIQENRSSFQAVVFAEYGWASSGYVPADPVILESIIIGTFPTFEAAKQACVQALREVIDYIGFTIKTISNAVAQPLAA